MQCVGLLRRFQKKARYMPGTGVVMSAGVYRKLIGKIFVLEGTVRREALKGSIPRPFVVVHSGNITTG